MTTENRRTVLYLKELKKRILNSFLIVWFLKESTSYKFRTVTDGELKCNSKRRLSEFQRCLECTGVLYDTHPPPTRTNHLSPVPVGFGTLECTKCVPCSWSRFYFVISFLDPINISVLLPIRIK